MVKKYEIWDDKLPEDKVEYFNKKGMSLELFAKWLGTCQDHVMYDLIKLGYRYSKSRRIIYKARSRTEILREIREKLNIY